MKRSNIHRGPGTDALGRAFSKEIIEAVWLKGRTMGIYATLRVDAWGWTIVEQDHGNIRSRYGWEIDHIVPVAQGGTDELDNLQPLQWENNRRKDEIQGLTAAKTNPQPQPRHVSTDSGSKRPARRRP